MSKMASIYKLEPEKLFTVPQDDQVTECKLCWEIAQPKDGVDLGPLYQYGKVVTNKSTLVDSVGSPKTELEVYCAHYFCLLFCSALCQRGDDDSTGMKGFLAEDILKEWRRAARLKCFRCNKKYATVGCAAKKCRRSYHLPCALRENALPQFCRDFRLYCGDHRPKQAICLNNKLSDSDARECGICSDTLEKFTEETIEQMKNIWSPCCNKWFHKDCIQQFATNSGYFFKCPLCNNKDIFEMEMKSFGVYVPEQDAAWETHENGALFDDLLERHSRCDALNCVCPEGRDTDEDYTIWEIILCWYCGAQGIHVKCGDLPLIKEMVKWKCNDCLETIKKLPKRTIHNFTKAQRSKSRQPVQKLFRQTLKDALLNTKIVIGNESSTSGSNDYTKAVFHLQDKGFSASFDLCPKYDIPLPVKLSNVPWEEKDPVLEQLVAAARRNTPVVQLERMELCDQQYSVYTIWSPISREIITSEISKINLFRSPKKLEVGDNTPTNAKDFHVKPRSPSIPKSETRDNCEVSPRSQSLPPNLNDEPDLAYPSYKKPNLSEYPLKLKFKERFHQKEALTTLKKFGGRLERSSRISGEMKDITRNKRKSVVSNQNTNEMIGESRDLNNTTSISSTKIVRGKRNSITNSPSKYCTKKLKHDNIENFPYSAKKHISASSENKPLSEHQFNIKRNNELPCNITATENVKCPKKRHVSQSYADTESEYPKGKVKSFKDASKTQKSILQYFTAQ